MPNFSTGLANGGGTPQSLTTTYKTQLSLTAQTSGLKRGKLYELVFGEDGTPADNEITWDVSRQTGAGTGTSETPNPLDPADGVAATVALNCLTVEPTVTANSSLLNVPTNQRATTRWVAAPGSELVWPATNLAGLAIRAKSPAYTNTAAMTAFHNE